MAFCTNCGTESADKFKFCGACGQEILAGEAPRADARGTEPVHAEATRATGGPTPTAQLPGAQTESGTQARGPTGAVVLTWPVVLIGFLVLALLAALVATGASDEDAVPTRVASGNVEPMDFEFIDRLERSFANDYKVVFPTMPVNTFRCYPTDERSENLFCDINARPSGGPVGNRIVTWILIRDRELYCWSAQNVAANTLDLNGCFESSVASDGAHVAVEPGQIREWRLAQERGMSTQESEPIETDQPAAAPADNDSERGGEACVSDYETVELLDGPTAVSSARAVDRDTSLGCFAGSTPLVRRGFCIVTTNDEYVVFDGPRRLPDSSECQPGRDRDPAQLGASRDSYE